MSNAQPPQKVIIIGAGFGGLAAVRTYLRLWRAVHASFPSSPSSGHAIPPPAALELTVLDAQHSPGGVWAAERLYPGLYAHALMGLFEFGGATMVEEGVRGSERYAPLSGVTVGGVFGGGDGEVGIWGGEGKEEGGGLIR